jgi:hypothetical protein
MCCSLRNGAQLINYAGTPLVRRWQAVRKSPAHEPVRLLTTTDLAVFKTAPGTQ